MLLQGLGPQGADTWCLGLFRAMGLGLKFRVFMVCVSGCELLACQALPRGEEITHSDCFSSQADPDECPEGQVVRGTVPDSFSLF